MTVKWKKDGFHFKADAEKVYQELMEISESEEGEEGIKPEDIVEFGRDENSELHKCFTWDNDEAAEKWRNHEARQIMCCLVYERDDQEQEDQEPVRVFYNVGNRPLNDYKPTQVIVKDKDTYQELLDQAWAELERFKAKYSMLSELKDIFALIA